jgi:hypothetical protein
MTKSVFSAISALLIAFAGASASAYTRTCLTDRVLRNVTCQGTAQMSRHTLGFRVVLEKSTSKQNPLALPEKVCTQLGPETNFVMYITDSANDRVMGFFSKFGSNHAGALGDKPDTDVLFNTGLLKIRAYAFDYGEFVKGDEVTFAADTRGVRARVHADLRENTGEEVQAISTDLNCAIN